LSKVVVKSGARPRIEMYLRAAVDALRRRPGRRAIDSAMEMSGSLPMSSAVTASTMPCSRRLDVDDDAAANAGATMPVTTIQHDCRQTLTPTLLWKRFHFGAT
jgi:hypothetical protein